MAQWLRGCAGLSEDLSSIHSTHENSSLQAVTPAQGTTPLLVLASMGTCSLVHVRIIPISSLVGAYIFNSGHFPVSMW